MTMDRMLRLTAGTILLIVVIAGILPVSDVHWFWKFFLIFMALNQIQSAFTNWCPIMVLYRRLGIKECKQEK